MVLNTEQKQIQELARDIASAELAPRASEVDRDFGFPREGLQRLAQAGLMGLVVPPPLGGGGADAVSLVASVEQIALACANTALIFVTHTAASMGVLVGAKDAVKAKYLPALARGEKLGAFAATESGSGANVFAVETSARRRDEEAYVVEGSKCLSPAAARPMCSWWQCELALTRVLPASLCYS